MFKELRAENFWLYSLKSFSKLSRNASFDLPSNSATMETVTHVHGRFGIERNCKHSKGIIEPEAVVACSFFFFLGTVISRFSVWRVQKFYVCASQEKILNNHQIDEGLLYNAFRAHSYMHIMYDLMHIIMYYRFITWFIHDSLSETNLLLFVICLSGSLCLYNWLNVEFMIHYVGTYMNL